MSKREARIETATRLQFSENSVTNIVKEKIALGEVTDNSKNKALCNAHEKLADEEIEDIRKLVSRKDHNKAQSKVLNTFL